MNLNEEVAEVAAQIGLRSLPVESPGKKKKSKTKTDSYDKKALLEILSGPEDQPWKKHKNVKKTQSRLSPSISPIWYVALGELFPSDQSQKRQLSETEILKLKEEAARLCQNERDAFEYRMYSNKRQGKWIVQVREKGTHADRIAAVSLLIRDSIYANIGEIDYLLSVAEKQKGSRDLVIHSLKALAELFRLYLLPDRKLKSFNQQPLDSIEGENRELSLVLWWIEDQLKQKYARFVSALESATTAPLDHLRSEAVTLVSSLLYDKPEQESTLLSILMNKLGDKINKLRSKVAFLISKLLLKHPRMKLVVLKEAEKFVYLEGTTVRAIQAVLQIFNSITYEHNATDLETATLYVDMCFNVFHQMVDGRVGSQADLRRKAEKKEMVKEKFKRRRVSQRPLSQSREVDATVFNSLISGIRRCLPFADETKLGLLLDKHLDSLFRLSHTAPFGVGVQVLALLYQILPARYNCLDRLYRAMYDKILDPKISESRKLPLFISTIFKAIKDDPNLARASAFVKRLFQIGNNAEPHILCAIILVTSEAIKFKPGLKTAITQGEDHPSETNSDSRTYRIDHREPIYSGADVVCLWEATLSLVHYHPTVRSMGVSLLSDEAISAKGDPLQELTLFAFLEKFVSGKNSRPRTSVNGRVPMTPGSTIYAGSRAFDTLAVQEVPVDEEFFHKYFSLHGVEQARQARKSKSEKAKLSKKRPLDEESEEMSELDRDDDLDSLDSLDLEGDEIDPADIEDMFLESDSEHKRPDQLYDYSDLLQDME